MPHLILDLFFTAIIIVGIFLGIKKGAVKIILSLVALIVAAFLAYYLSTPTAVFLNNKYITLSISSDIYESLESGEEPSSVLPDYINDLAEKSGINLDSLILNNTINKENISKIVDSHLSESITRVVSAVLIPVFFIIFSFILKLFVNIFSKLVKHSFVGGINSLLGAIFGALNGCVIVTVICIIISLLIKYSAISYFNISEETVNSSLIYSIFLYIF